VGGAGAVARARRSGPVAPLVVYLISDESAFVSGAEIAVDAGHTAHGGTKSLSDLFVREILDGIDDTGVKAAFLKCAVERQGLVGDVPRILALIAAAAVETGAPVMVHTNAPARTGLPALETLTKAGVDPRRIVIAHAGDRNDLDYLHIVPALLAAGVISSQIDEMLIANPQRFFASLVRPAPHVHT
jgi:predicted metal-dependent phosphotriesterase family hydrolase